MKHANAQFDLIQDPTRRIPVDEPVFLLRGTDPATPAAIHEWLRAAMHLGAPAERRQAVRDHLDAINKYQIAHPDLVHVPGTTYPLQLRKEAP